MGATNKQLQEQLNMANAKVAELMKEVETLKERNEELHRRDKFNNDEYRLIKSELEIMSKNFEANLDQHRAIEAENYALKSEIERTNRHINLAENQLHKEQQPLVVNHYHNCTINK